jgi:hypothetical protein
MLGCQHQLSHALDERRRDAERRQIAAGDLRARRLVVSASRIVNDVMVEDRQPDGVGIACAAAVRREQRQQRCNMLNSMIGAMRFLVGGQ